MTLQDIRLVQANLVGGESIADWGQGHAKVVNPYDGSVIGEVPHISRDGMAAALEAARKGQAAMAGLSAVGRERLLLQWARLIAEHREQLARILMSEQGKPIGEARGEIDYALSFVDWYAAQARRVEGDILESPVPGQQILVSREPIGICLAITPWNFPCAMVVRKLAPALAAGCAVIVKPAPQTPLTALYLVDLAVQAGFPAGALSVITGHAPDISDYFLAQPEVAKLTFTGSTATGRRLYELGARHIARLSLELGGNAPFLVFEDADLDLAVDGAMKSKFRNAGQTCVCANRFLVHRSVMAAFTEKLQQRVGALRFGPLQDESTTIGTLIDATSFDRVSTRVEEAVAAGATVLAGGAEAAMPEHNYYPPTILADVTPEMAISCEEIFGPVVTLTAFDEESEAIDMANDTHYGLASYFYTRDLNRVFRVKRALRFGIVGVNEGAISNAVAPFGGIKHSGLGLEGGKYGIEAFLAVKYTCIGGL